MGQFWKAGELHSHHASKKNHSVLHYLGKRAFTLTYGFLAVQREPFSCSLTLSDLSTFSVLPPLDNKSGLLRFAEVLYYLLFG